MKLSKREIIMLSFLILIALIFIEVTLIITPGKNKLDELNSKNDLLANQVFTINLDLSTTLAKQKTVDENLAEIEDLSAPFLNRVSPDSLLLFTHTMLINHGFSPLTYSPQPLSSQLLQPQQAEVSMLTYKIKEIAIQYRALNGETPTVTPDPTTPAPDISSTEDLVELYSLQVIAVGNYEQIKALLVDYDSLGRNVMISNINMTPNVGNPALLDIEFWINYYGIQKLTDIEDPINTWPRSEIPFAQDDPFVFGD